MTCFGSIEGKISRDSVQNKILTGEIGIQNLLTLKSRNDHNSLAI
jgi:hypothetical protein